MRLCLSGHGRTFTDVAAHITANRLVVAERLESCIRVLAESGPITAFDAVPLVHGDGDHRGQRELVAVRDALLPAATSRSRAAPSGVPGDEDEPERWRLAG